MRRILLASAALVVSVATSGIAAYATIGTTTAGAANYASKTAFCSANDAIDRASVPAMTNDQYLAVLKANSRELAVMKQNLPPGKLGRVALQLINQANAAISSNNANNAHDLGASGQLDTYCRVNGDGQPLPPYFDRGNGTAFCKGFLPIFDGVTKAPNAAGILAVFNSHKAVVSQLASEVSRLPKSIRAKATATTNEAKAIIAANNPETVSLEALTPALPVAVYCGRNL